MTPRGEQIAADTILGIADDRTLDQLSPALVVAIAIQRAIDAYEASLAEVPS